MRIAYFDQNRDRLDPELSLRRALAPEGDTVLFRDRPTHVAGWAARFLFPPEQLDLKIDRLSGGERARVHIARLMLQPADILLLDEPTNDLDIPTLEVLENNLADFPGAIVLITHDRYLLDRLSTLVLALDGAGGVEYFAELSQWEQAAAAKKIRRETGCASERRDPKRRRPIRKRSSLTTKPENGSRSKPASTPRKRASKPAKSSWKLPEIVSDPARLTDAAAEIEKAQAEVDRLYERWAELEAKRA